MMKTLETHAERKAAYDAVRGSSLFDKELKQYKICESLKGQSFEIGRMLAFAPGWLENESIWLHMSFKFYLEMIRAGLYKEFWEEMVTAAPAFMDPAVYTRPPTEAASFIVSSAHPDESLHGAGFLPRLSGSTAEWLSMWNIMFAGMAPFSAQ